MCIRDRNRRERWGGMSERETANVLKYCNMFSKKVNLKKLNFNAVNRTKGHQNVPSIKLY